MLKTTPKKRVLFVRRYLPVLLALFGVFSYLGINLHTPNTVYATAAGTVNFQARLQSNSGAIVPDGYYNVEFKLYSVSSGGTALWTEDYTYTSGVGSTDARIQVKDGYLSAALGSITAFPGTIDWSQQLYLTMNIGGTGNTVQGPSGTYPTGWDGEMSPRLALTATPYSFDSGELGGLTASQFGQLAANNTWTGTSDIQNTSASAFEVQSASGGAASFTVNTSSNTVALGTNTELALQGASSYITNSQGYTNSESFGYGAVLSGNYQTAIGSDASTSGAQTVALGYNASASNTGAVAIGDAASATNSGAVAIGYQAQADYGGTAIGGQAYAQTTGISIGDGANTGNAANIHNSIAIGVDANNTTQNQLVIGGSTTNGSYINNVYIGSGVTDSAPQSVTLNATGGSGANIAGANINIAGGIGTGTASGGNINLQIAKPSGASGASANSLATVASINGSNGSALFENATNSTTAFQVQNSVASTVFGVDTANKIVTTLDNNVGTISGVGGAGRQFSDGFESGNFNEWTQGATTSGTGSTVTVGTTHVRNGKYAAQFNIGTSGSAYVAENFASGVPTMVARAYVYVSSQTTGAIDFFAFNNGSFDVYRDNATGNIGFWDAVSSTGITTSTAMSTGTWHEIELDVTVNGASGTVLEFLDGAEVLTTPQQTEDTGSSNISQFAMGEGSTGRAFAFSLDDLSIDTVRPGDSSSLNVADSLHVSGTSSFDGGALFQSANNANDAFQVQNASGANLINVDTSGNNVNVGSTGSEALASGVNIATASNASYSQVVNIGSSAANTSDVTTIQGGSNTTAAIVIAPNSAGGISVGGTSESGTITLGQSTVSNIINVGNGAVSGSNTQTVNVGTAATGTGADAVTLGSLNGASSTTVQGGSGGVSINASSGSTVSIGTAASESVTIGSSSGANPLTFQGNGISQVVTGSSSAPSDVIKTTTNSTNAFQIQDASGTGVLNVTTSATATVLNETWISSAPSGTLVGGASWSSGNYTILNYNPSSSGNDGEVNYNLSNIGSTFTASFSFWSYGAAPTYGDGIWFYAGDTGQPTSFHYGTNDGGYSFAYSDLTSKAELYWQGTLLASSSSTYNFSNQAWHTAQIVKSGNSITMYLDGTSILTYTDSSRTLTGTYWGLGGCSCGNPGAHYAKNFSLTASGTASVQANYIDALTHGGTITIGSFNAASIVIGSSSSNTLLNGTVTSGTISAIQPGTTNTAESWHYPTLNSPFKSQTGSQEVGYKMLPDGTVEFAGVLNLSTGTSWSGTVFTLPTGYHPSSQTYCSASTFPLTSGSAYFDISTSGAVTVSGTSSTTAIVFDCDIPMDGTNA